MNAITLQLWERTKQKCENRNSNTSSAYTKNSNIQYTIQNFISLKSHKVNT